MFRRATITDLEKLLEIKDKVVEIYVPLGLNWTKSYPTEDIFKRDILKDEVYILEENNEIIGSVVLNSEEDENYNMVKWCNNGPALVVHRLMINPKFSNKGLGKRMLLEIEDFARKAGLPSIKLDTCTENVIAIKLYKSMGYNLLGEIYLSQKGKDKRYYCLEKNVENL
ncbi:MAG: GNAT family N-acetyltransferase [Clostridium sp.]